VPCSDANVDSSEDSTQIEFSQIDTLNILDLYHPADCKLSTVYLDSIGKDISLSLFQPPRA